MKVEFLIVVIIVMISFLHLIQGQSLGRQRLKPQKVRKISNTKIIFREDDNEPLLPIPTFPTSTSTHRSPIPRESVSQNRPTKQPIEKATSKVPKIKVESVTQGGRIKPATSAPVTKRSTTAVSLKTTAKPQSSFNKKRNPNEKVENRDVEESPMQNGSYYVPFKKMGN